MKSLSEGIFQPSTSELLARKSRTITRRPTFKDRIGNIVGAIQDIPSNVRLGGKTTGIMLKSGGNPSVRDQISLIRDTHPKSYATGAAIGTAGLALAGYATHKSLKKHQPQSVNASGLIPGSYILDESIIDTVKEKVSGITDSIGNGINAVKNRVQTNVGKLASAIGSGADYFKKNVEGIGNTVGSIGNRVRRFASDVVGSKNVT